MVKRIMSDARNLIGFGHLLKGSMKAKAASMGNLSDLMEGKGIGNALDGDVAGNYGSSSSAR